MPFTPDAGGLSIPELKRGIGDVGECDRRQKLEKSPAFDGSRGIGVVVVIYTPCPQVLQSSFYNKIWQINQLSRVD